MDTWQKRRMIYDMSCQHTRTPLRAEVQQHVARDVIVLLTSWTSWWLSGRHSPTWLPRARQNRVLPVPTLIGIAKFPLTSLKVKRYFIAGCRGIKLQDPLSSGSVRPNSITVALRACCGRLVSMANLIHPVLQNNYKSNVVVEALWYRPECRGFEAQWGARIFLSIYLILPAALGT
jgi:hypothetical protein